MLLLLQTILSCIWTHRRWQCGMLRVCELRKNVRLREYFGRSLCRSLRFLAHVDAFGLKTRRNALSAIGHTLAIIFI